MLSTLIISTFTIALLKTVRERAGFGSQSTLSRLRCKGRPLALGLCYAISKGAGKMKKRKMKKMLIQVIPSQQE